MAGACAKRKGIAGMANGGAIYDPRKTQSNYVVAKVNPVGPSVKDEGIYQQATQVEPDASQGGYRNEDGSWSAEAPLKKANPTSSDYRKRLGLANGGIADGVIPGKVNPKVADDVTINAKKGEYILSVEDVAALGGPKAVAAMVQAVRKGHGIPTKTGPKRHDQPDALGRMDKPQLRGIADVPGLASGGVLYGDEFGNVTPSRPMTLQENYGMPRNVSAGEIDYTGTARPVGPSSGISRPGVATGEASATEVPVNPRNLPAVRPSSVPAARGIAGDLAPNTARGFTLGAEGATVSPTRPARTAGQLEYIPPGANDSKMNIDAEVRANLNRGSRAFVGPQEPVGGPAAPIAGNTTMFGGRGGAQVVDPSGGLAGVLYRKWSDASGRYIPGIDKLWGGKPATRAEMDQLVKDEMARTMPSHTQRSDPAKVFGKQSATPASSGLTDAPLRFANQGLGPNDLSRMSNGSLPPSLSKPKIAPGMQSIAQLATNAGLPSTGSSLGTSTGGPSVQLDGNKGLGDTTAISNRVDWSPGSANVRGIADMSRYNDEVAQANRVNSVWQQPQTLGQMQTGIASNNTTWDKSPAEQAALANTQFGAQEKNIADTRAIAGQRGIAELGLEGHKYAADKGLESSGLTAAAHVKGAEIEALGKENAARVAHVGKAIDESKKDFKELSANYFNQFSKLNLPNDVSGRIPEIAKDYAAAADPSNNLSLNFMKSGSNKGGFLADKTLVNTGLQRYAARGYNLDNPQQYDQALSSVYSDLLKAGKAKQVPNMYAFMARPEADKQNANALMQ